MQLDKQSQLWKFIDRYISADVTWRFEQGKGDVCALVRAFLVAVLKCAGLAALAFLGVNLLLAPFYGFWTWIMYNVFLSDLVDFPSIMMLFGVSIYIIVLAGIALRLAILMWESRTPRARRPRREPSAFAVMVKEHYAGFKGKYCARVELK